MNAATRDFLRTWVHAWRFPDLWLALLYDGELDEETVARRAAQALTLLPTAKDALEGLLTAGEMEAASRLLTDADFSADPDVMKNRVTLEARLAEEVRQRASDFERTMATLQRRARRYGITLPPVPRKVPVRWIEARKIIDDATRRIEDAASSDENPSPEPRFMPTAWPPPALIAWPVPNAAPQVATGWFLGRGSPPPVVKNHLPDAEDEVAWNLIRALDDLCTTPGRRWTLEQATTFVTAFAALVGAEAGPTRQQGEGFASELHGLDEPGLAAFPDPPGSGVAFWLAPRGDSKGQESFGDRFRIAFQPERDFVRRPQVLRLDGGMLLAVCADRSMRRARLLRAWARDVPLTGAIPEGVCHARRDASGPSFDEYTARLLGWLDVSVESAEVLDRLSWYSGGRNDLACALLRIALGGLRSRHGSPRATLTVADIEAACDDERFTGIGLRCLEDAGPGSNALVEAAVLLDDSSVADPVPIAAVLGDASDLSPHSPRELEEALGRLLEVGAFQQVGENLRLPLDGLGGLVRRAVGAG